MQLVLLHHGIVKHMVNQSFGVIEGDIAISFFLIKFWKDDTYCPLVFSNHGSLKNTMRRLQFINYLHFRPDDECSRSGILLLLFFLCFLFLFCFFACVWVLLFFVLFLYVARRDVQFVFGRKGRTHHKLFVSLYPNKQDVKNKTNISSMQDGTN